MDNESQIELQTTRVSRARRLTRNEAAALLREAEQSDLSLAAFAVAHGLGKNVLYAWRQRFARSGTDNLVTVGTIQIS